MLFCDHLKKKQTFLLVNSMNTIYSKSNYTGDSSGRGHAKDCIVHMALGCSSLQNHSHPGKHHEQGRIQLTTEVTELEREDRHRAGAMWPHPLFVGACHDCNHRRTKDSHVSGAYHVTVSG